MSGRITIYMCAHASARMKSGEIVHDLTRFSKILSGRQREKDKDRKKREDEGERSQGKGRRGRGLTG